VPRRIDQSPDSRSPGNPAARAASGPAPAVGAPGGGSKVEAARGLAVFEKCRRFTRAREVQAAGLYPYFRPISDSEDSVVVIEGKKRIMMGSNNYLGLTHHPKVLEAADSALRRYGSGCTGSRFLNGTLDLHHELEAALAEFVGKEDCLVFSTGYMANVGCVSGLVDRHDLVFLDKLDHASIVDGAGMSHGRTVRFNHGDLDDLDRKLQETTNNGGRMIMVDGVFSMEGTLADVPGLIQVAKRHRAALVVDDAHSLGVVGPDGDGTCAHYGVTDDVDIITGTFSKSLASIGGFVAASENVIHYLKHHSRPLIFSASLPPASTAGVLAALRVIRDEPERRDRLWSLTRRFQDGLRAEKFDIGQTQTPIIPVLVGPLEKTFLFWRKLFDAGVYTNPVVPPAVPPEECRLRASIMAAHTEEQIDAALDAFRKIGRELGVI
jgi:8-amino-7-oxononanoate synthase